MPDTNPSSAYFDKVASQWDSLRTGYFTEDVRAAAIAKAYLHPGMVVGDIGAGTGFLSAGLAPLVKRVYAFDGSPAMLEVARQNLAAFDNVVYEPADGLALPLPDDSLDAVFANMYLHHCPDPLAAIREMARILRPGGRLILTDLDTHPYTWLKEEMADVWQGFERGQVQDWFAQAGLVNRIIDCTGQSCCAQPEQPGQRPAGERQVSISIFVAAGAKAVAGVHESVQAGYAAHAEGHGSACCSSGDCCASRPEEGCGGGGECECGAQSQADFTFLRGYSENEAREIPGEAAEISLGCGNPTAIEALLPGQTVVDIGSGGGIDAFLSANRVGKQGKVIGVDMTPAMIERARATAEKNGYTQVEFRLGQAEQLPVEDSSVDVVLSNCVINLTQDKGQVFREIFRVLKEGGRLQVSDIVTDRSLPGDMLEDASQWAGCVSGALPEGEYIDLIRQAGFGAVSVRRSYIAGEAAGTRLYSAQVEARKGAGASSDASVTEQDSTCACGGACGCCGN